MQRPGGIHPPSATTTPDSRSVRHHVETVAAGELKAVERDASQDAVKNFRGSRTKAARLLSAAPRIFDDKARRYGFDWRHFDPEGQMYSRHSRRRPLSLISIDPTEV
jgi:hypothetical protein